MSRTERWQMADHVAVIEYDEQDRALVARSAMDLLLTAAGGQLITPRDPDAELIELVKEQFGDSGHSFMSDADARRIIAVVRGAA